MKTLNKKILAGLLLGSVIATGALYAKGNAGMNCSSDMKSQQKTMSQNFKAHGQKGKMAIFSVMKELNLTQTQKDTIKKIVMEQKQSKMKMSDAFSKNSFDKEQFIKAMNAKRENKIARKAEMIGKVYAVLDNKQKAQFKTILELRESKMGGRMN